MWPGFDDEVRRGEVHPNMAGHGVQGEQLPEGGDLRAERHGAAPLRCAGHGLLHPQTNPSFGLSSTIYKSDPQALRASIAPSGWEELVPEAAGPRERPQRGPIEPERPPREAPERAPFPRPPIRILQEVVPGGYSVLRGPHRNALHSWHVIGPICKVRRDGADPSAPRRPGLSDGVKCIDGTRKRIGDKAKKEGKGGQVCRLNPPRAHPRCPLSRATPPTLASYHTHTHTQL